MMDREKQRMGWMLNYNHGKEVKKMDWEKGYEWEEGLFFLEETDPPEGVLKGPLVGS